MIAFIIGTFLGCCVGIIIFYLLGMAKDEFVNRINKMLEEK